MIILFGPTGAGKSVQGQLLSEKNGWAWLSAGELLRKSDDSSIKSALESGLLVDPETTNNVIGQAISKIEYQRKVVLDGFPRDIKQAEWLIDNKDIIGRTIGVAIVLIVPEKELLERLLNRNRADDNMASIKKRLDIYHQKTDEILRYLDDNNVRVVKIDGTGTIEQVHERIMVELEKCKLE